MKELLGRVKEITSKKNGDGDCCGILLPANSIRIRIIQKECRHVVDQCS